MPGPLSFHLRSFLLLLLVADYWPVVGEPLSLEESSLGLGVAQSLNLNVYHGAGNRLSKSLHHLLWMGTRLLPVRVM